MALLMLNGSSERCGGSGERRMDRNTPASDHCYRISSDGMEWTCVTLPCDVAADADTCVQCGYNLLWTDRAGDVVYTLMSPLRHEGFSPTNSISP
uniref:Uncharacterized protein n=1 Tax=Leersia perrieri TaxID=77586 RepID=A0A0D9X4T2_9ORYZ